MHGKEVVVGVPVDLDYRESLIRQKDQTPAFDDACFNFPLAGPHVPVRKYRV
jgi:hypothetical protein